jgi:hypothetical protein
VTVPQPLTVVTNWGAAGIPWLAGLIAAIAAIGFFYWRALQRARPLSPTSALVLAVAALVASWCLPVLFSSDVYAYAAYGEMARIGLNPYAHAPTNLDDPVVRAAQVQWVTAFPTCVYGPAFVEFARSLVSLLAPLGMLAQLDGFRLASSIALLLCVPLAGAAFGGDCTARRRATVALGLNPVVIWSAAEGHNDAQALVLVLAGFALVHRGFAALGAAVAALSALLKAPGIAAAIALGSVDRRARLGAIAGACAVLALGVPVVTVASKQLVAHGTYAPQASLQAIVAPLGPIVSFAAAALVSVLLLRKGVTILRWRNAEGWIWLALAAWVLIPNPYPWYSTWLVAAAAMAPRSRAGAVAILLSFTSLLRYVPDAIGTPAPLLGCALGVAAAMPLALLAVPGIMSDPHDPPND